MTTCDCDPQNHKLGCPQQPKSRESYLSALRHLALAVEVDPDLNPERLLAALLARYEELVDEALGYADLGAKCLAVARAWNAEEGYDLGNLVANAEDAETLRRFGIELAQGADAWMVGTP